MEKRYQVFISSTYLDLIEERKEVLEALLELDCLPAGMELFPAANEDQWSYIKKVIDDSDYYVLIIGGRYGSTTEDGLSYTEKEYDYAIEQGKPVISFIHGKPEELPAKFTELDEEKRESLEKFRAKVQSKLCKFWNSTPELGAVVSRSIVKLIKQFPADGWVRGFYASDPETVNKLNNQIKELQSELNRAKTEAPKGSTELAQGEAKFKYTMVYYNYVGQRKTCYVSPTWNEIIKELGPYMYDEASSRNLKQACVNLGARDYIKDDHDTVKRPAMDTKDYHIIITQLNALGIITKSERKRTASDKATYWTLTPYGLQQVTSLIAIKR